MWYSTATNVEIELPVTSDATNPIVRTSMGSAAYAPENDALVWKIKSFPGNKVGSYLEFHITCHYYIIDYKVIICACYLYRNIC